MKKLSIDDIKKYSMEVLCDIRDICEKYNLSYSLTGGTLIGAIRHKGFIPWDDDIDIMMPRADYDKFIKIVKEEECNFNLLSIETCGDEYRYPFAKACHKKTLLKEKKMSDNSIELGVYVDIFPVDGMANHYWHAKIRCMVFQFLRGIKIASNWDRFRKSKLRKGFYEPFRYVCYLVSRVVNKKHINQVIDRFTRKYELSASKYVGRILGDYGSREIMPESVMKDYIKVEFENQSFSAIKEYDYFLRSLYGDYMQLPPIEKQVTHHEFEAYLLEE